MNKEELFEKFEKNVKYLQENIPPDDIYPFAEQTFMACMYFLKRWSDFHDLHKEIDENPISAKWIRNILSLQHCREEDIKINLDLGLHDIDEDNE